MLFYVCISGVHQTVSLRIGLGNKRSLGFFSKCVQMLPQAYFDFFFNFHKTMNVEFLNAVLAKKYLYVYRFWCLLLKLIQNLSRSCFKGFLNISHRNWWKLIICFPKEFIFFFQNFPQKNFRIFYIFFQERATYCFWSLPLCLI